ncbi:MAG: PIN domain-containing protein [DPANN group archaeon]|nr:PIN domain-containing protein [DPANN group archaeon]
MKVIIDTNAFVYAAENKIDIFALLKGDDIIIPNLVLEELQVLAKHAIKASDRKAASLALKIIENHSFNTIELSGSTDKAIGEFAKREGAAVLTNDMELKRGLAKGNVKVLHIRQKKYIEAWA